METQMSETVIKSKRKMRPGGGKAKGNGFEGLIAKKLSAALPLNFMRSPGSGARVGGKNFEKIGAMFGEDALKLFVADVVPINERQENLQFKFSIECKAYATADNFTSLATGTANVFKWFEESVVDSQKIGRLPMLIMKWNHTPIFVAVIYDECHVIQPKLRLMTETRDLAIYELDELLKTPKFWVSPT